MLPVLDATENEKQYPTIMMAVIITMFVLYNCFGQLCYFVYGNLLTSPLITTNLPPGNPVGWFIKIAFCINLIFSYPLIIYPANEIIETYLFSRIKAGTKIKLWIENIYRAAMVMFTVFAAIWLDNSLNRFLALLGAVACAPIAFTLPAAFHLQLCAKTKWEKTVDIVIIVVSIIILVFCTWFTLDTWNQ